MCDAWMVNSSHMSPDLGCFCVIWWNAEICAHMCGVPCTLIMSYLDVDLRHGTVPVCAQILVMRVRILIQAIVLNISSTWSLIRLP